MSDDRLLDDDEAALEIGAKILDMIDRLLTAHRIVPGPSAVSAVTVNDVRFEVAIKVAPQ